MRYTFFILVLILQANFLKSQDDIKISTNTIFNGENSLAANPKDQKNLVCAWMTTTQSVPVKINIATSFSLDGGLSWSAPYLLPRRNINRTQADPTVIFDPDGNVWLGYIDYRSQRDSGEVYVVKSSDKGSSWMAPVKVIDVFASADKPVDRPWLTYNEKQKQLVVVTKSLSDAPKPHKTWMITSPATGSLSFGTPVWIDDSIPIGNLLSSMAVPACDANGNIYAIYLSYTISQSVYPRLILAKSNNGGASFTYRVMQVFPTNAAFPKSDSLYQYSYHIAVNPVNQNELTAVCSDYRYGDEDVLLTKSTDGGNTWSAFQRLNDDTPNNGKGQDMCWGGYNKNGIYASAWRDRRNETDGQLSKYQVDAGYFQNTWKNDSVSAARGSLYTPVDGNDFLGIAVSDSFINCTWADARSGINEIYFNRIKLKTVSGLKGNQKEAMRIIPNPVHEYILLDKSETGEVRVFDVNGNLMLKQDCDGKLDIRALPVGSYILTMKSGSARFVKAAQ
jgi:hypothetical protein